MTSTDQMGSIRGGAARKLIIYSHPDKPGWCFPREYENERAAWKAVREGFIGAFEYADKGAGTRSTKSLDRAGSPNRKPPPWAAA
jgi:hypothetical protein